MSRIYSSLFKNHIIAITKTLDPLSFLAISIQKLVFFTMEGKNNEDRIPETIVVASSISRFSFRNGLLRIGVANCHDVATPLNSRISIFIKRAWQFINEAVTVSREALSSWCDHQLVLQSTSAITIFILRVISFRKKYYMQIRLNIKKIMYLI